MTQRMALILAGALTAFMLVLMCGVAATVAFKSLATASAQVQPAGALAGASDAAAINAKVTSDQATQIALGAAPGAKITRAPELVNFRGTLAYEVVLTQGNVYIDANNGTILFNTMPAAAGAPAVNGGGERHHEDEEHEGDDD